MKKTLFSLTIVSLLFVGLQSFKMAAPSSYSNYSVNKFDPPWLAGYTGRILLSGDRILYMNGNYPGTITDMVILNSDSSFSTVVSWTAPTTDDTINGGYKYTGRVYYLTDNDDQVFMAISQHIETNF